MSPEMVSQLKKGKLVRLFFAIVLLILPLSVPAQEDELELPRHVEGKWGWGKCKRQLHTIKYSPNKEFLEFNLEKGIFHYFIAGMERKGLKVVLLNEDRFDIKGNLVYWYMVFKDKNTYYWLRSDRAGDDLRGPVTRCR